ncbi:MAG TPA: hypothetical protein VMG12_01680 [Polyangiaceae bacterium]|nr:hypothetical protein [Polyangiaceae bacterium]
MIGSRAWRGWAMVGMFALMGAACGGDDDADDRDTQTSTSPLAGECALPDEGYSAACDECSAAQCCDTIAACRGDAECERQFACVVRCQSAVDATACYDGCAATHPAYLAYEDCSFEQCLSTCWM